MAWPEVGNIENFFLYFRILDFWKDVPANYIKELSEDWAYGFDLKLFGYSIDDYMEKIGYKTYFDN